MSSVSVTDSDLKPCFSQFSSLDKPTVTIERHTSSELEDGRGSLTLTCMSKSNPPGRTLWYKAGESTSSPQYKEQLVFDPITKQQAGDYVCAAENSVGRSEEAVTSVQVLCKFLSLTSCVSPSDLSVFMFETFMVSLLSDGPENLLTSPLTEEKVIVHNKTILNCTANAVPAPAYEWLQEIPGSQEVRRRSNTGVLEIDDVWYADQGKYRCVAYNNIGNYKRELQSEPVILDVTGM